MVNMDRVNNPTNPQGFKDLKDIKIQTGKPLFESWEFTGSASSDDTYNSALNITFDRDIYRGDANINGNPLTPNVITIIQSSAGYRLPAILTESQWTLFRTLIGAELDAYYTRGTSGYINGTGPDTTAKYILNFEHDTYTIVPSALAAGGTIERFAETFRQAESIKLPINSSAITIDNDTVKVSLQGNNALKVLGATYEISYPAGFIVDILSNPCDARSQTQPITGVSRPAIRIKKSDETITLAAGDADTPRFTAAQPGTAQIRMDCRTPGSSVRYTTTEASQGDTSVSWGARLALNPPQFPVATADPARPDAPGSSNTYFGSGTAVLSIGPAASALTIDGVTVNVFNGYKYRIRAVGNVGGGTNNSTNEAEEIAYRTVIVFKAHAMVAADGGQVFGSGDQLWIRGGNTLSSTNIPGFPLTPEDVWSEIAAPGKRAGIRLMSKLGTETLNNSVWQWVTWHVNSKVYYDLYLGHDLTSSADTVFKYGPKYYAKHVGNWSSVREFYVAFPGQRRLLQSNAPSYTTGSSRQYAYNFNGTVSERPY